MKYVRKFCFLPVLIAAFLILDYLLSIYVQPYILYSGRIKLNDFEVTQRDHPEAVWDKVFFGNSVVISAFREEESTSGYINLGLDYGVVTDLWDMIRKNQIQMGSELVIGLNSLTMYDDFDTNPYYQWHRTWYQPYCYFERDRLKALLEENILQILGSKDAAKPRFTGNQKPVYYGCMSTEEVKNYRASEHYQKYLTLPPSDFEKNFASLNKINQYCQSNGIRLRLVWMPTNPVVETDDASAYVYQEVQSFSSETGVEFYDMTGMLDAECFYDGGHLNYEYGAHVFTGVIDRWLVETKN